MRLDFQTSLGILCAVTSLTCVGCKPNNGSGVAIQEVLLITQEIRDAISNEVTKEQLRSLVYNRDVITMVQDGFYKILAGFTTITEVLKLIDLDDEIEERKN